MNRTKNIEILVILILTLLFIKLVPVACFFKATTGISCPICGMTRAFESILHFDFSSAFAYNILSIPLFLFLIYTIIRLVYEVVTNRFDYVPLLGKIFTKKIVLVFVFFLITLSFVVNNIK